MEAKLVSRLAKIYAIRRSITHCDRGHKFTPSNTEIIYEEQKGPGRICRRCRREEWKRLRRRVIPVKLEWEGYGEPYYTPTLDDIREVTASETYDIVRQIMRGENLHVLDYQEEADSATRERKLDMEQVQRELRGGYPEREDLPKDVRQKQAIDKDAWWREKKRQTILRRLAKKSWRKPGRQRAIRLKYVSLENWQEDSLA